MPAFRIVVLLTLASPGVAWAQSPAQVTEARVAFEEAENEYERGHMALALRGYQRSYALMEGHPRRPLILYNIARCFEELDQVREARDAYRQYLATAAGDAEQRADVEHRLAGIELRIPAASASPGDQPSADPGVAVEVDASATVTETSSSSGSISPVGPIVLGVGGAMVIGGAIAGGLALSTRGDVTSMCTAMACPGSAEGLAGDVETLALVADVLLFGGAAIAATGLLLSLVLRDGGSDDAVAGLTCAEHGCVATLGGRIQ